MTGINMNDVISAWQDADPDDIHPLRKVDRDAYWDSGKAQATDAAVYIPDGGLVLDYGAGEGRVAIALAAMGFEVVAADTSEAMLDRLAENVNDRLPKSKRDELSIRRLLLDDPTTISLGRRKADTIISRAVLIHHGHSDVAKIVVALADVLKKGGHFIADWPLGPHTERGTYIGVTTWDENERAKIAKKAGLTHVTDDGGVSVWRKA